MTDRYRKKSVEVRAWKIGFDGQEPDWVREAFDGGRIDWCPAGEGIYINTLEGRMKASIGDMLIEGVKGELYGCRADIFAATYEPVETTPAAASFPAQPATELHSLHAERERDALLEERDALREVLQVLVNWTPSADTYRRLGFNPEVPMRAHDAAKALLAKGEGK